MLLNDHRVYIQDKLRGDLCRRDAHKCPDRMTTELGERLQAVLDRAVDAKLVFGTSFALKQGDHTWQGASGNFAMDDPYFIASTTKLFTTAIILKLRAEGRLGLDDRIGNYLDPSIVAALHVYKGKDHSDQLAIRHLLAHTSGLPDYFQGMRTVGKSLERELKYGNDRSWTFEQAVEWSKRMPPLFVPAATGKAHYSDTNFQLLGRIVGSITQRSYAENCDRHVIHPLGLSNTYLYQDPTDKRPRTLYFKSRELHIPKAMASFTSDGGMVSTSSDMLTFIEAFFTGKLFPVSYIDELQVWNKIFSPMRAGVGIHRFKLPWFFDPTGTIPYFIGHSGLSGALAYHSPKEGLYVAGTVNQLARPDISFRTMIKLTQKFLRK